MPIKEFQLKTDDIRVNALTRVDKALLIDLQGRCYAFGVISEDRYMDIISSQKNV